MKFLSTQTKLLTDFILPPRCPICGVIVEENYEFCLACWQKLDFLSKPWCVSCGKPFAFARKGDARCADCLETPLDHDGVRAVVSYDDNSSLLAMRLKYGARLGLAELMARHLRRFLDKETREALVLPVPLHRSRLWSRGFNQSVLIGRSLAEANRLQFFHDVMVRHKATPPLRNLSAAKRSKIVSNAFSVLPRKKGKLIDETIILVDDVYTTGSTANACARILKQVGAAKVFVFCWARVLPNDERI